MKVFVVMGCWIDLTDPEPNVWINNIFSTKEQAVKMVNDLEEESESSWYGWFEREVDSKDSAIVLDKEIVHSGMPTRIDHAKIALINSALEIEKTEMSSEIRITDPTQMQMFLEEENRMLKGMVDKLHDIGCNVLI